MKRTLWIAGVLTAAALAGCSRERAAGTSGESGTSGAAMDTAGRTTTGATGMTDTTMKGMTHDSMKGHDTSRSTKP